MIEPRSSSYPEIPGFEDVVLEESFVPGIAVTPGLVTFHVELALTPEHPAWTAPGARAKS